MKIPKYIKDKMKRKLELQEKVSELTQEICDWLENKGIDTKDEDVTNSLLAKLDYNDISVEKFEEDLNYYIKNGEF